MALPAILGALAGTSGGAAAGNAVGMAAGQAVSQAMGWIERTLSEHLPSISRTREKFKQAISLIPDHILSVANDIQQAVAKWGAALYAPIDTLKVAGNQLTRGVARVNPATVQQFNIALEDAEGVIGRQLLPVMVRFTQATRAFADYLVKIEPITSRLAAVGVKVIDAAERLGKTLGDDFIPVIDYVTKLIEIQVTWWTKLAKAIDFALKFSILGQIVKRTGLDQPAPSSVGSSIRNVRYMGSEEIQQEVARQSLIASMAGGPNKDEQAKDAAITAAGLLQQIFDLLRGGQTDFGAIRDRLAEMAKGATGGIVGNGPISPADIVALTRSIAFSSMGGGF